MSGSPALMGYVKAGKRNRTITAPLVLILTCYVIARILEIVSTSIPRTAIVALDVLSAMTFALVDGARSYGLRTILVFAVICTVVGNVIENIGVTTGFPFGRYWFVELMGPKLFHVPLLLGLAYIGMAYVSWTVARLILGHARGPLSGSRIFALSMVAAVVMTAWDLAQDPVWSTVLHGWIWRDGGSWFGVPVSNYLGWLGAMFTIFVIFAIYLSRRPAPTHSSQYSDWLPALIFYSFCAAGNVLQATSRGLPEVVRDPTGKQWKISDILLASALVSIFLMGGFVAAGLARLRKLGNAVKD